MPKKILEKSKVFEQNITFWNCHCEGKLWGIRGIVFLLTSGVGSKELTTFPKTSQFILPRSDTRRGTITFQVTDLSYS